MKIEEMEDILRRYSSVF